MPCDTVQNTEQARAAALARLEKRLAEKAARFAKTAAGIAIVGWNAERAGWCDGCAVASLKVSGSFEARQAIARAETSAVEVGIHQNGH